MTSPEFDGLPKPPEWMRDARCVGVDPELFFSEHGNQAAAKRVCSGCPVRTACLSWALAFESGDVGNSGYASGVYGGLTANERTQLRRRAAA